MSRVKVYATGTCPYCVKAKALLDKLGIPYREVRLDLDRSAMSDFARETDSARTVPQIIIDGECVGGYTELTELHMDGGLDGLIGQSVG
jgi:glutaredoxin 3